MSSLGSLLEVFGGMGGGALAALVIVSAFALAAFAIHAVLTATKRRR